MYERRILACDTCGGKRQLWLRGGDYVECPACNATGEIEIISERVQAKVQERFIPRADGGLAKQTKILLPHGWSD